MNKLLFTRLRGKTAAVLVSEKRVLQIEAAPQEEAEALGTIYIGRVRNVVKNLNAAFVEYRPGVNGYYSLSENRVHVFADGRAQTSVLKSGDEILVQVSRAAVKTKDAVLTSNFSISGRYAVLTPEKGKLGISSKIKDRKWRDDLKAAWESRGQQFGLVVRTNAYGIPQELLWEEAELLYERYQKLLNDGRCRTCYSVLYRTESFSVRAAMDANMRETEEIVTDMPEIYKELLEAGFSTGSLTGASTGSLAGASTDSSTGSLTGSLAGALTGSSVDSPLSVRLYADASYPLAALYHLESALDHALSRTVWLKSGGYLVIEPTEAMTVIDVNTGKNVDKKTASETYLKTNLEAAEEIAVQLRLRNLSGIILIDFIDMEKKEHNEELLKRFGRFLSFDPVKTVLVDMTALGLVEVTRKKIKQPLHEQF